MKNRRLLAISILFLATTVSVGVAARPAANADVDAGTAFSRMKALVGDWDVESSRGKAHSRFELIAGGSVLLEHFTEPGGQEMLTAYHLDSTAGWCRHITVSRATSRRWWRRSLMARRANWISHSRAVRISPPARDTCTTSCFIWLLTIASTSSGIS